MSVSIGGLFAGVGGPILGAKMAGLEPRWVIEPRKYFNLKTHRTNFPGIPWSNQIKNFFSEPTDIIWGSPSCGEFSSAGRSSKNAVKVQSKEFEDFEYVQCVSEIIKRKPLFFVLENLPSIRNYLAFEATHSGFVLKHQITKEILELPNYYIEEHRIQPTEVEIPQIRDRLFIIGSLSPYKFMLMPPLEDKRNELTIKPIFEKLDKLRKDNVKLLNDRFPKHSPEKIEAMERLKPGEGFYGGLNQKRLDADKPSPVIMSSATKYIHPWENRTLTVREAACLMGYPLDFVFYGSENGCLDMVGKGVVPQVVEFILKQIKEYLEENRI